LHRARIRGAAPAVWLCATHQPEAVHWRFTPFFFADRLSQAHRIELYLISLIWVGHCSAIAEAVE